MAVSRSSVIQYYGLAADTKPTTYGGLAVVINARFFETDTGVESYFNGTAWVSLGERQSFGSYLIYIAGANKKRMNLATKIVEDTNTDAYTVTQNLLSSLGAQSGATILFNKGFYSLTNTIVPPSYVHLKSESQNGIAQFRPTGDFPALEINGLNTVKVTLENMYFTHNQPAYTSCLLNLKASTVLADCRFRHLSFYDFEYKVGSAIGLDGMLGSIYRNNFFDIFSYGLENFIKCDLPSFVVTNFFTNNNRFTDCQIGFNKRLLQLTGPSGAAFDDNIFIGCEMQSYTGTLCAWDYETGYSGSALYSVHVGCMVQDLPGVTKYALVNTATHLGTYGCYPAWKIGGAGAATTHIRTTDNNTLNRARSTQSGNGTTKIFNIPHDLSEIPKSCRVTVGSVDAQGTPSVTADATNVIITYPVAPPSGTNNLVWNWEAAIF